MGGPLVQFRIDPNRSGQLRCEYTTLMPAAATQKTNCTF